MRVAKHQPIYFYLKVNVKGSAFQIKGCQANYHDKQSIYKLAIPTVLDPSGICWLVEDNQGWKCVIGNPAGEILSVLISALMDVRPVHQLERLEALRESA